MEEIQEEIPLVATHLNNLHKSKQQETVQDALEGLTDMSSLKARQVKELQRLMADKGLSIDIVLSRYKEIITDKKIGFKGSDVLKVLERVEKLLGFDDKSEDQLQIRALIQTKSASEITSTLIEVTTQTQAYLTKLKERRDK